MSWTLRMRFAGPMQSWGTRSRFDRRDTEIAPSKSGVIGLVAAALGRGRTEPLDDLAALRMGVRLDDEGVLMRDLHTAQNVIKADGSGLQDTALSERHFIADATFLVGLEGKDKELLAAVDAALERPRWPLALGRRSFPPSKPVYLRPPTDPDPIVEQGLEEALVSCPPLVDSQKGPDVRYLIEDESGDQYWFDQLTDNFADRGFVIRRVRMAVAPWGEPWS